MIDFTKLANSLFFSTNIHAKRKAREIPGKIIADEVPQN